ncbi:MAG: cell division protein FtsQ/DivIB [Burkholderiales bacterium]
MTEKSPAIVLANVLFACAVLLLGYSAVRTAVELPFFALREVWILGSVKHISRAEIEAVIKHEMRGNFFTLDLRAAKQAFEKLAWVRTVSLSRAWPNTLVVRFEEQVPLARWGKDALINVHGERFAAVAEVVKAAPLPEFIGPDGSESKMAEQYRMFARVLEPIGLSPINVRLSERGAWQLRLSNDLSLDLGREDIESRLARFVEVYPQFTVLTDDAPRRLDLRYDNGFALTRSGKG